MDLHSAQIQDFFSIPVDNMRAEPLFIAAIRKELQNLDDLILVTPDAGGAKR